MNRTGVIARVWFWIRYYAIEIGFAMAFVAIVFGVPFAYTCATRAHKHAREGIDFRRNALAYQLKRELAEARLKKGNLVPIWHGTYIGDTNPVKHFFEKSPLQVSAQAIADYDSLALNAELAKLSDVNAVGKNGMTLLEFAYREGNVEAMDILLERGASPDLTVAFVYYVFPSIRVEDHGRNSLLSVSAINESNRSIVFEKLLPFAKDPQKRYENSMTLLHWILEYRGTMTFSDERNIEINSALLRRLIDWGVPLEAKDEFGRTAADICKEKAPHLLFVFEERLQTL